LRRSYIKENPDMSIDVYAAGERIVAGLTDEECDAILAAIYERGHRWELTYRGTTWLATHATDTRAARQKAINQTSPGRRRPGWLEAIRGVECCDPAVRDQWRVWRACFLVIGIIVMVAVSAGLVFGNVAVVVVLLVVFALCAAASHRITGGKASVCH
jgi:hypothetical protein